jgi:hypothetical protein
VSVKVFIRNLLGQYLACDEGEHWSFTDDRRKAHVFDYQQDDVAEELRIVQRDHGAIWVAEPLDPNLRREICDRCGVSLHTREAYFDGARFLCPNCRSGMRP